MQRFHLSLFLAAIFKAEWSKLKFSKDDFLYKKFWLDWARFGPDSGHKVIFKARTEWDKARHLSGFFIADKYMAWVSEKNDNQVYKFTPSETLILSGCIIGATLSDIKYY